MHNCAPGIVRVNSRREYGERSVVSVPYYTYSITPVPLLLLSGRHIRVMLLIRSGDTLEESSNRSLLLVLIINSVAFS
jgi:hypothetical protein